MEETKAENGKPVSEIIASYPSAELLVEACFQDYLRIQESYNKLYEKVNMTLAFLGVILTLMMGTLTFPFEGVSVQDITIRDLVVLLAIVFTSLAGLILVLVAVIRLLFFLRGKQIPVFCSEDIRNQEIYRENREVAALWLIDKYTKIVCDMRTIMAERQRSFNNWLTVAVIGIVLYVISMLLQKGGF